MIEWRVLPPASASVRLSGDSREPQKWRTRLYISAKIRAVSHCGLGSHSVHIPWPENRKRTKGRLHHRSLNLRSTERVQRLELVQFRVQVICVAQGFFELVLLNPSLNRDLYRPPNLMYSYWLIEHPESRRDVTSCQPGSRALAERRGQQANRARRTTRTSAAVSTRHM